MQGPAAIRAPSPEQLGPLWMGNGNDLGRQDRDTGPLVTALEQWMLHA